MRNFFEHKTAVFLTAATVGIAILIGIFSASGAGEKANAVENAVGAAAVPGQSAAAGAGGWLGNFFGYFGSVKALRAENERLKAENVALDKRVRDAQGLEDENRELRSMLDLTEAEKKLDLLAAQVIAKDPSNWYSSFTIGKGSNDGIQKNQPVLTANKELIGQVYKVGSNWAEIITILDPESGVGSMVERSGDIGILEGDSALRMKGQCRLGYLSRNTDIEPGDYVETSGLGGIYPKGLLVGKVLEVREDNTTMSKYASVEPVVEIGKLSQVFVLKNHVDEIGRTGTEEKSEEEKDEKTSDSKKNDRAEEKDGESTPAKTSGTSKPENTAKSGSSSGSSTSSKGSNSSGSSSKNSGSSGSGSSGSSSSKDSNSSGSSSSGGSSSGSSSSGGSSSGNSTSGGSSSKGSGSSGSGSTAQGSGSSGSNSSGTVNGSELRE